MAYADTNIFCHYVEIPTTLKWLPPVQSLKYLREKHLNVTNTLPPAVRNSWMIQSGDFRPPYNINQLGYVGGNTMKSQMRGQQKPCCA